MTLHDDVRVWIADDPDPVTRTELQALLDAGDDEALADRFAGPLHFGTAGLRGPVRGGPSSTASDSGSPLRQAPSPPSASPTAPTSVRPTEAFWNTPARWMPEASAVARTSP
ncbi:MAG: hypothetical protein LH469_01245, partial [Frankiaceae bacterium]|nr:hypothetical protein [Frankiaceae bacterium]